MIRKIGALGISLLCFAAIISCEKDFNDIGSGVVNNTKFETGEILLDVEITPIDIESVRADNIELGQFGSIGFLGEYWLGVYNSTYGKKIEGSIITQIGYKTNAKVVSKEYGADTTVVTEIDKAFIKIPYPATNNGKESDGKPKFRLDSILGDPSIATTINVFRNNTYLHSLNPNDPAKKNSYESNTEYLKGDLLSDISNNSFTIPQNEETKDTILIFDRKLSNGNTFKDTLKLSPVSPFMTIPLDKNKIKSLFLDQYETAVFDSKESFDDYLRGIIIEASGNEGALIPFNLANSIPPTLEIIYTNTILKSSVIVDTIKRIDSYPFNGLKNSKYTMGGNKTIPSNSFIIQGTAGSMAEIKFLDATKLQELKANNWLINDASLTFHVNQEVNSDKNILPQKLIVYQNKDDNGVLKPTQLTDIYEEAANFGGNLELSDDAPSKYTFKITDYISDLLDGSLNDISPLALKVYNSPTDNPINNNILDTKVKTYNWNPRNVVLLNGDETANGNKRAVLKISYSKEK